MIAAATIASQLPLYSCNARDFQRIDGLDVVTVPMPPWRMLMADHRRWRIGAQRDRAERYLVITIAAFAITVGGVRWYLDIAGYPTVGGGELHVAHVLWGGLALFLAALVPLLWVGRRALMLSALLAGIGVGLFIDEVGKFLTTSSDYFFAPAAPIIYGSILLLVLMVLVVRRRDVDHDDATHALLEALIDGADGRLTAADRARAIELAQQADHESGAEDDGLQATLVGALQSTAIDERLGSAGPVARGDARRWLERLLPTRLEHWLVVLGLIATGLIAAAAAVLLVAVALEPEIVDEIMGDLAEDGGRMDIPSNPIWFLLFIGVMVVAGGLSTAALVLLRLGRRTLGLNVALLGALVFLGLGGLVAFYAVQFGALTNSVLALVFLGLIIDYRIRIANGTVMPTPRSFKPVVALLLVIVVVVVLWFLQ